MIYAFLSAGLGILILIFIWWFKKSKTQQLHYADRIRLETRLEFLQKENERLVQQQNELEERYEILRQDNQELIARISIRDTEYLALSEKLSLKEKDFEALHTRFTQEFEHLATKIMHENSEKFGLQNQINLDKILKPLQEKIRFFEEKVSQTHKESIDYHAALRQQIIGLKEMNQQMSQETLNLTKALKGDSKKQGNWGELILDRILTHSGLEKGREYEVQLSHTTENGRRLQPDVVVHLPDAKKMIIDSKVSLTAYEQYCNAEDHIEQNECLKRHLISIKNHIQDLTSKNYTGLYGIQSLDFVLMFVPIETAFSTALQVDPHLYTHAFEKNIIIVTPATLLATLRTIETLWKQQKQQDNAYEIARQAGLLYDKFEGFVTDLNKVGDKLNDTQTAYEQAFKKLSLGRGNLLHSVQKLKDMGANSKKNLDSKLVAQARQNL